MATIKTREEKYMIVKSKQTRVFDNSNKNKSEEKMRECSCRLHTKSANNKEKPRNRKR